MIFFAASKGVHAALALPLEDNGFERFTVAENSENCD